MSSERNIARLRAQLPPRPETDTGEPFPPRAPAMAVQRELDRDPYRETRLSRKPDPPPGKGPVLAWHRENQRSNIVALVFSLLFLATGFTVISLIRGDAPFEWIALWPAWAILFVTALLMSKPWRVEFVYAGADWVSFGNSRRKNGRGIKIYELAEIRTSVAVGRRYLLLRDRDNIGIDRPLAEYQQDRRIWDLVYNGIVHSVADGADIRPGDADTLGLTGSPAMLLNQQQHGTTTTKSDPAPERPAPEPGPPRPIVDLPTFDPATPPASTEVTRKSGVLRGSPDLHDGCVWLERQDGTTLPVIWPYGFRARFAPLELLDPTGRVIASEGSKLILTGAHRPPHSTDDGIHNWIPGLDEAFAAHSADAV